MVQRLSITLVKGYHSVTPVPELARSENLDNRFAVVFDTFNPDAGYMYFYADLFCKIMYQIAKVLKYDTAELEYDNGLKLASIEALNDYYIHTTEEDREPPLRVFFRKDGRLTCLEETEFWVLFGGPTPYHDSYTAAFYTRHNMAIQFQRACSDACKSIGNIIINSIEASPHPVR